MQIHFARLADGVQVRNASIQRIRGFDNDFAEAPENSDDGRRPTTGSELHETEY